MLISSKRVKNNNPEENVIHRICKFKPSHILPFINKKRGKINLHGITFNFYSRYLIAFKYKGIICAGCGITTQHVYLEHHNKKDKPGIYNLKLYGVDANNNEILMTMDHIIPKSKGGTDNLKNIQPMCNTCNQDKGNKIPCSYT